MRGVELEATGDLGNGWEVAAGYTYTDTEFKNNTTAQFYTPQNMLQLWGKYRFQQPQWSKLQLGAGIKAFSDFRNVAANNGVAIEAGGYAVVDLLAAYDVAENVTASVSVNNLFDKKYYERVGGVSVFNFYGEPRSVTFKLSAKF
jgi:outer membrane receptor for ferric coprogen and ferric-rhodotorulic acid